jgi:hypothetical protein
VSAAETASVYVQFVGPGIAPEAQDMSTTLYVNLCITQSALLCLTWISFTIRPVQRVSSSNITCRQRNVGVPTQNHLPIIVVKSKTFCVHFFPTFRYKLMNRTFRVSMTGIFVTALMLFTAQRKIFSLKGWEVT